MAVKLKYGSEEPEMMYLSLETGEFIEAEGYDGIHLDGVPEGKYDYYVRHSDNDCSELVEIKKNKGLTVNFWGTIVLDAPLQFPEDKDFIKILDYGYQC